MGTVLDEKSKALEGATVQLIGFKDSLRRKVTQTDKDGAFSLENISFGYYKLRISFTGFQTVTLDSIYFRAERFDFNLNDIVLKQNASSNLEEVIIYAEKPLVQSKDGNITFNAGESALSGGSNASDLLTNVPLVTKDPSGKLLVRGKEPKILIDDKPVELNLEQLQDLLESMPGSSIEKIEVLTNPPPQYANEQGGVINIVTKKGAVGINGRINVYGGTRGEAGGNASFNYRKQGFSVNVNAGAGFNQFAGSGYSNRQNIYADSTNNFYTSNNNENKSLRPNFRANMNYDVSKNHSLNLVLQYNQNNFNNQSYSQYKNLNRLDEIYRLSERNIVSHGDSYSPNISFSYTMKTNKPGESLKLIGNVNNSSSESTRDFYQQFFNPDHTPNGKDSTQQQTTENDTKGYSLRLNYDLPIGKTTSVSTGTYYIDSRSDIESKAFYIRKADNEWAGLNALTNHFLFYQDITNVRGAVKQVLGENFSITGGLSAEQTKIRFDLFKTNSSQQNNYWTYLPFGTLNKTWKDVLNLTFSYRRTVRRPGVNELNPTIDSSDQFNIRSGNPELRPSLSHNFDMVIGKTKNSFYANLGFGYNIVSDVFSQLRVTPTEITWQNISGRKEYEVSTWSGYTVSKRTKISLSASYSYNAYSNFDKEVRKFRDGGSFTSNFNANYNLKDLYNATGSFTFNRFANPQGIVSSTLSMNIGLQAKLLKKKLVTTFNIIDPFANQQRRTFTYGTNFALESYSMTQTRSFRLSLAYVLSKSQKKKGKVLGKDALKKAMPSAN
jgi:outer membrane receptor protein involved in Fe transport